jgi:hypothetical protein
MLSPRELFLVSHIFQKRNVMKFQKSWRVPVMVASSTETQVSSTEEESVGWEVVFWGTFSHWNEGEVAFKLCSGRRR